MTSETNPLSADKWATLKRVMPRDVYDEWLHYESLIAENAGLNPRFQGIGPSVEVYSIFFQVLREVGDERFIEAAQEWKRDANS